LANINDGVLISNGGIAETTTNLSASSAGSKVVFSSGCGCQQADEAFF
jgi:hypothetical protein